jgi:acid phosphatase (class A)
MRSKKVAGLSIGILSLMISAGFLSAQSQPSAAPDSAPHFRQQFAPRPTGYLEKNDSIYLSLIPPYPVVQSQEDEADLAGIRQWRRSEDSARWQLAKADADVSYGRFAEAFGSAIDRATAPLLVRLLDRVQADLSLPLMTAKKGYNRPRPYQRLQLNPVCGFATPPVAQESPKSGDSYPSGHTTWGWATALILAEVAPKRAQTILVRGREYGESRIVCGVHWPSDVRAGEAFSSAIVGRIHTSAEFRRELGCARQEHEVATKVREQLDPECTALKSELEQQTPANKIP